MLNLSGRGPSICYRRPFCRLKAPPGLLLLRCAAQTRSMRFERSGRGQEPSRGHKFPILENFLSIRDFTSQTLASFPSDLVGVALVGAKPLHLLSQTALPLKSPTGAFIASQTLIFRRKQIIRTHLLSETSSDYFCLVRVARIELTAS